MEGVALVIGIVLTAFLVLYFGFLWDKKEHFLLRLLVSFFFLWFLFLVPKATLDFATTCDFVVNQTNSTMIGSDNVTIYSYDRVCADYQAGTAITFHKLMNRFAIVVISYIFVYFLYVVLLKHNVKVAQMIERISKRRWK